MIPTIEDLKNLINYYDTIIIGAGAGLSAAAGFEYGGKTFLDNFKDMYEKYGYTDMYSAGFHNFSTEEEKWGYWCRSIYLNRYKDGAKQLYLDLYKILKNKNYFVITTNVDHQFQLAGFDKKRLFYTQGDYGLFQCSKPCHKKTYDNEEIIKRMKQSLIDNKIPSSLIPKCPKCGRNMSLNLRSDNTFVEDEGWHKAFNNYQEFLSKAKNGKVLFLELGVGYNTPAIIKYPFMRMTYQFDNAFYVCVNQGENYIPDEIIDKSLIINEDLNLVISELLKNN